MSKRSRGAASGSGEVRYQIDGQDALVSFNDGWDEFASANESPALKAENITRRSLWDFISNPEVKNIHEKLLRRARFGSKPLTLPFRCDSPALRRFMEMDIVKLPDGNIEYRCRVLRTEARSPVRHTRGAAHDDSTLLRICSWCNKVEADAGRWLEIEDAVARLDLLGEEHTGPITHTLCDACLTSLEGADR